MSKLLSWIVLLPLAIVIFAFCLSNLEPVPVNLGPAFGRYDVPFYLVVLACLFVGVIWGGVAAWSSGGATRRRARQNLRRAETAELDVRMLKDQVESVEGELRDARKGGKPENLPVPLDAA